MLSKDHPRREKLTYVVFFFSSLFLIMGLFLAVAAPVNAQVGTPTAAMSGTPAGMETATVMATSPAMLETATVMATSPAMETSTVAATSAAGGGLSTPLATSTETAPAATPAVPVTGVTSRALINSSDLTGYSVIDRDGNQIGAVNSLVMDLRGAAVCAPAATGTAATPSAAGLPGCRVTNTQTNGLVSFVVVDRSGVAGGTSAATATPAATSAVAAPTSQVSQVATGGNFVPVPWRFIRINLDQHQLIVDATQSALNNAPSFASASDRPDFFASAGGWPTAITRFWDTSARISGGAIPATGGTATAAASGVPTLVAPQGTATALVPVTGIDLSQVQDAAAAQQRMVLDIGIVGIGLALLVLGILIRTGKGK